jgi:hypothetical protein
VVVDGCRLCGRVMRPFPGKLTCSGRCRAALSRRRRTAALREGLEAVEVAAAQLARALAALRETIADPEPTPRDDSA